MNDFEIIEGLIARDNYITYEFFFVRCRPLFRKVINKVFDYPVDYDEFVNELYLYLMENDAERLRSFAFRSTLYQWLKVTAIRYFLKKRDKMIDCTSKEGLNGSGDNVPGGNTSTMAESDLNALFSSMRNKRYVYVIQRLVIDDEDPEQVATEMNVTTANLYNIKRRAMEQLVSVAINDIENYGR